MFGGRDGAAAAPYIIRLLEGATAGGEPLEPKIEACMERNDNRVRCAILIRAACSCMMLALAGCNSAYRVPQAPEAIAVTQPAAQPPFWWGVSTAPFQIEEPDPSRTFATDWDLWGDRGSLKTPRDQRVASYEHMSRDVAALKALGVTHYRFGVEWARIEPAAGKFNEQVIDQYAQFCKQLLAEGITPIVCLWHYTFPGWLADFNDPEKHGWLNPQATAAWERYVRKVVPRIPKGVTVFAPQNEPNAYALMCAFGEFPPGKRTSVAYYDKLIEKEIETFRTAARIVHELRPDAQIMSIQNVIDWEQDPLDPFAFWYNKAIDYNHRHLDGIKDSIDLLGFNYYAREVASPLALYLQRLRFGAGVTDLGWYIEPDGLERVIVGLAMRYGKPMVITENGIADRTDEKRPEFIFEHLLAIRHTIDAGYDVRGYFHWSLLTTFEWMECYEPVYGLYAVNPDKSLAPKDSAALYSYYIRNNFMRTTEDVSKWTPEQLASSRAVVALKAIPAVRTAQARIQSHKPEALVGQ